MAVKKKKIVKKTTQKEFVVEWVEIDSVKLWEDNPRMNDDASEKLAEIIKDHGVKSPIVCWDKNRTIYKGNTTWKACKLLGMKKVPVVFHEFSSEVSAKAYGIADNKASELADWDEEIIFSMMTAQEFKDVDLETGFTDREVALLDFWPPEEEEVERAEVEGKELRFKVSIEVGTDQYTEVMELVKKLGEDFKGSVVR